MNDLDESYKKPGRINMFLNFGNEEEMVDSASRFVVIYRFGSIGAPAAAEMYTKAGTSAKEVSWARVMAAFALCVSQRATLHT